MGGSVFETGFSVSVWVVGSQRVLCSRQQLTEQYLSRHLGQRYLLGPPHTTQMRVASDEPGIRLTVGQLDPLVWIISEDST